jgi:hypothetical protein
MDATQYDKALRKLHLTHLRYAKLVGQYDSRWPRSGVKGAAAIILWCLVDGKLHIADVKACRQKDDEKDPRYYYDRLQLIDP